MLQKTCLHLQIIALKILHTLTHTLIRNKYPHWWITEYFLKCLPNAKMPVLIRNIIYLLRIFLKKKIRFPFLFRGRFMLLLCSSSNPYNSQHPRASMGWWLLPGPLATGSPNRAPLPVRCLQRVKDTITTFQELPNADTNLEANKRRKNNSLQKSVSISINQQKPHPKCNMRFKTKDDSHMNSKTSL